MVKKMTEEEAWRFKEEGCTFLDYKDIQEYIEDIVVCLVYSSWHYSEERARELCKQGMAWIEEFFEQKEAAYHASADIGYCCG